MNDEIERTKEAKDRETIHMIQSQCVHRRQGVMTVARLFYDQLIFYCQDCEKILYGQEAK